MRIFDVTLFVILILANVASKADDCKWYHGRPLPECRNFLLIETDWHMRFSDYNVRSDKADFLFSAELGFMHNFTTRSSLGLTLYGSGDDDAGQFGLRARYRFWINRIMSLDISPGVLFAGSDNYMNPQYPGFIGSIALGFNDILAISLLVQVISFENLGYSVDLPYTEEDKFIFLEEGTQTSWYVGIRGGSLTAAVIPIVLTVLYAATAD